LDALQRARAAFERQAWSEASSPAAVAGSRALDNSSPMDAIAACARAGYASTVKSTVTSGVATATVP
jgi:hypothetical protein